MRILIARLGAYGDCLIVTPLIRYLKQQGHEIVVLTSEDQGKQIFHMNPHIDKLILHKRDSIGGDKLGEYFKAVAQANECEKIVDLCESIEVRLALHPSMPQYKYTKYEKMEICNRNYYEETLRIARHQMGGGPSGLPEEAWMMYPTDGECLNPEIFFTEDEERFIQDDIRTPYLGKRIILWGLSGSSRQKTYPPEHMVKVVQAFPDFIHITVGDEVCRLLEWPFKGIDNVVPRSGKYSMRESILASKYVDLVIAPDTGLLHGSGCWNTPKIGLLTNTTIENITKHFKNNHSLEAKGVACAPCFNIIYKADVQAQVAEDGMTPLCMQYGIEPERIIAKVKEITDV